MSEGMKEMLENIKRLRIESEERTKMLEDRLANVEKELELLKAIDESILEAKK